jgi:DNA gyrase subunit B
MGSELKKPAAKTAERNFKKLSNVEHVRMRTGMWLGQNSLSNFQQHFFRKNKEGIYEIFHEEIEDIPAKIKCLDEACMNAIDEYRKNQNDKSIPEKEKMNRLVVSSILLIAKEFRFQTTEEEFHLTNAEGVYLHLMYGENFDDKVKEDHVAGQNGVGISLVSNGFYFFPSKNSEQRCHVPQAVHPNRRNSKNYSQF